MLFLDSSGRGYRNIIIIARFGIKSSLAFLL